MEATFIIPDSRGGGWVGPLLTPLYPSFSQPHYRCTKCVFSLKAHVTQYDH